MWPDKNRNDGFFLVVDDPWVGIELERDMMMGVVSKPKKKGRLPNITAGDWLRAKLMELDCLDSSRDCITSEERSIIRTELKGLILMIERR